MNLFARTWNSLHARLLVGAALWVVAALTFSDFAISTLFRQHVTGQFLHDLTDHLSELQGLSVMDPGGVRLIRPLSDPRFSAPGSGFYWEVSHPDGTVLAKSPSLAEDRLRLNPAPPPSDPQTARLQDTSEAVRMVERIGPAGDSGPTLRFSVAAEETQLETVLHQFNRLLDGALAVLAIGLMSAAAAQVAIGLHPMRRLRRDLSKVRAGEAEQLPGDFPEEVRSLVSDLNAMICANQEMVRRARAQAGNLAHALRGPLAILADEARQLGETGQGEAAAVLRQQCDAMTRQIDYQTARARAAATRAGPAAHTFPATAAGPIVSAVGRMHHDRALVYENQLSPTLAVACDVDDLNEMMANLVENAAKWARTRVRLSDAPARRADHVRILVEDDGPGIPAEHRERVFGIGERLDERAPGSGLGLSIVRDLAELYGGSAVMDGSELGGAMAVLELPRASD